MRGVREGKALSVVDRMTWEVVVVVAVAAAGGLDVLAEATYGWTRVVMGLGLAVAGGLAGGLDVLSEATDSRTSVVIGLGFTVAVGGEPRAVRRCVGGDEVIVGEEDDARVVGRGRRPGRGLAGSGSRRRRAGTHPRASLVRSRRRRAGLKTGGPA